MTTKHVLLEGTAFKFGDHVNTDLIIPATHLVSNDPLVLGKHLMAGHDPDFVNRSSTETLLSVEITSDRARRASTLRLPSREAEYPA